MLLKRTLGVEMANMTETGDISMEDHCQGLALGRVTCSNALIVVAPIPYLHICTCAPRLSSSTCTKLAPNEFKMHVTHKTVLILPRRIVVPSNKAQQ